MKISVMLCNYNRCQILVRALTGVAGPMLPEADEWQVLVVDNNSSDQTHNVVRDFCQRYPGRFRYVFEPQQGLSHARNAGIREAPGDVLVFVDDDVTIAPMWLQHLIAPLRSGEYAGAGGRILPERTCPAPRRLPSTERYALAPFAIFELGPEAGPLLDPPRVPVLPFRRSCSGPVAISGPTWAAAVPT